MVNLIVPDDRVASRANLYTSQGVAMDVVLLQDAAPIGEEVHAPLQPAVDLVVLEGGVALPCDPHPSIRVSIDLILDELATPLQMKQ